MSKQATYYFDTLKYSLDDAVFLQGNYDELSRFLHESGECISSVLNQASKNGNIEKAAYDYINGDIDVVSNGVKTRQYYENILNIDMLPKYKTRRWLDLAAFRIKGIIKWQATRLYVSRLITENPTLSDIDITQMCYDNIKQRAVSKTLVVPTIQSVKNVREQLNNQENDFIICPTFDKKLPFNGTERICIAERHGNDILCSIGVKKCKIVKFTFKIPNRATYQTGKICKPDVLISDDKIVFAFAVRHKAPSSYEPKCIVPVDVGVIHPFVACVMTSKWKSQAIYPDKHILYLSDKAKRLTEEKNNLKHDIEECLRSGRNDSIAKKGMKKQENYESLLRKIDKIHDEIGHEVAHRVCEIAANVHGEIVLERLSWAPASFSFFPSRNTRRYREPCTTARNTIKICFTSLHVYGLPCLRTSIATRRYKENSCIKSKA